MSSENKESTPPASASSGDCSKDAKKNKSPAESSGANEKPRTQQKTSGIQLPAAPINSVNELTKNSSPAGDKEGTSQITLRVENDHKSGPKPQQEKVNRQILFGEGEKTAEYKDSQKSDVSSQQQSPQKIFSEKKESAEPQGSDHKSTSKSVAGSAHSEVPHQNIFSESVNQGSDHKSTSKSVVGSAPSNVTKTMFSEKIELDNTLQNLSKESHGKSSQVASTSVTHLQARKTKKDDGSSAHGLFGQM